MTKFTKVSKFLLVFYWGGGGVNACMLFYITLENLSLIQGLVSELYMLTGTKSVEQMSLRFCTKEC